ncbi:hypothetical protein DPMN_080435 [Dreissena polymorpha]|uniref:Uncharacterized protein n=1 Tax=Dreissena polymorpha TaxID=45954 RepID=A0A9D3YV15_DREPO|nr:hypothetical protein DPMN_080435 [Dreissena polymorpha]
MVYWKKTWYSSISQWEEALKKTRPPKRKATDSLFLLAIIITFDSTFAESATGIFQARLNSNFFSDRRAMESLKWRQSLVKDAPEPTGKWFTFHDSTLIIKEFASLLGIQSSDIHSIRKKENIIIKAFRLAEEDTQSLRSPSPLSLHPDDTSETQDISSEPKKRSNSKSNSRCPQHKSKREQQSISSTPTHDELPTSPPVSSLQTGT